jgi:hypothetical protein
MEISVVERVDGFPDNKPVGGIISNHKGRNMLRSIVSDLKRNPPAALLIDPRMGYLITLIQQKDIIYLTDYSRIFILIQSWGEERISAVKRSSRQP